MFYSFICTTVTLEDEPMRVETYFVHIFIKIFVKYVHLQFLGPKPCSGSNFNPSLVLIFHFFINLLRAVTDVTDDQNYAE